MSDKKIIAATVQVNTGTSNQNLKEVKGNLKEVRSELGNTGTQAKQTGKDVETTGGSFSKLKGEIGAVPGPLGAARQGVDNLSKAFKALLLNPVVLVITLIVGALALLYKAFASTNDGADKLEQVFAGIGAAIDVLRDRVLKVGNAIVKFFSGDFKGAIQEGRAAVSGIGAEIAKEFNEAADAAARLQEVEDAFRSLGVSRAKLNRDLAETKEIISDENASLADKKKAIDAVRIAEGAQTAAELEAAKKRFETLKAINELSDTSDEALQRTADAEAAMYALEEKSATDKRSLNKQERNIEKQEAAKAAEARTAAIARQKEERQKLVEFTNKLIKLQQDNELSQIKDGYEKELKQLEIKIADEKRQNELAFKDHRINKDQLLQLNAALDLQAGIQRGIITDKHNEETKKKEEDFQKELAGIATKIRLAGITDSRQLELAQLEIGYQEKLQQAIDRYKDDQEKFNQIKIALDAQFQAEQDKANEKFRIEDGKKKLDEEIKEQEKIIAKKETDYAEKIAAFDLEQALVQKAFDDKLLTEQEYTAKVQAISEARQTIREAEAEHTKLTANVVGDALTALSELAGKQTLAGKVLAIAATTINTYQAAIAAYKSLASIQYVGPVLGAIAAASAIATGFKAIKKIAAVQVPGGSGGSAPSGISIPAAPVAPQQQGTTLNQDSINQIGNATSRVYVLSADVANDREKTERLNRAARLGG